MWPFKKTHNLPGVYKGPDRAIKFDITDEENKEIKKAFEIFKDYAFKQEIVEKFEKGLTAYGLSSYANNQIMMSNLDSEKKNRKELIERAIAAIGKAYSFHRLPIYFYDLACFFEMSDTPVEAKKSFKTFLELQLSFKPDTIDNLFLQSRDVDEAIKDAEGKIKES